MEHNENKYILIYILIYEFIFLNFCCKYNF